MSGVAVGRDYYLNGPTLVQVKGMVGTAIETLTELGTCMDKIVVIPRFVHQDIKVDDFGPTIPPEIMALLMDVTIRMTLVNFDAAALEACIQESLGGTPDGGEFGTLPGAGIPLGGGVNRFEQGNHYIGLNLSSLLENNWRFKHCYLPEQPVEWPLGSEHSLVKMTWRCIPYTSPKDSTGQPTELVSQGVVLFDRTLDT